MRLSSIAVAFLLASSLFGQTNVGSMAQLASGGSWTTTITLVNTGTTAADVLLSFFDNNGVPLIVPLFFPQLGSTPVPLLLSVFGHTMAPGALFIVTSTGPANDPPQVGWVQVIADGSVSGLGTIRQQIAGSDQQGTIPLENRSASSFILPFDNSNGFVSAIALANTTAQSGNVNIIIRDDTGNTLESDTIALSSLGHTSFVLKDSYGSTDGKRGTVEFDAPAGGQISVLGIQYNNTTDAFSTVPPIAE